MGQKKWNIELKLDVPLFCLIGGFLTWNIEFKDDFKSITLYEWVHSFFNLARLSMKKYGKLIALILSILILVPLMVHNADKSNATAQSQIVVPNPPSLSQPTPVETIITQPDGTVIEKVYTYNPDTSTIAIDPEYAEENASLFFPGFELGFLFAGGYWVDHDGYYWNDDHWERHNDDHWNDHWNNYWHNQWNDQHWRNHWQQNHQNSSWKRNHPQNWSHPGGRSPGTHQGGRMEGRGGRGGGGRR
jgi:hypothetical protein